MDFQDILAQNGGFGCKIGQGVIQCWPSANSFLLFGVVTSVPLSENRSRNATTVGVRTDRQDQLN